ncbi:MAG: hypothetical protein KAT43_03135 [Nanoarchaeota archaeon]|nr:hypothetical protein [Nanoarchaeota archaeon]
MGFIGKQLKFVLVIIIVVLLFGIAYRLEPRLGLVNIEYEVIASATMTKAGSTGPFKIQSEWDYKPTLAADGKTTLIKLKDEKQVSKNQFMSVELTFMIKDAKSLVEGTKVDIQNLVCDISRASANYREVITTYEGEDKIEEVFQADESSGWVIIDDVDKMQGTFDLEFKDFDEEGDYRTIKLMDGKLEVKSRRTK